MYRKQYLFSPQSEETGCVVRPEDLYTPEKGYGFVTEKNMEEQALLQFPEFNGGFLPAPWYRTKELTRIEQEDYGCVIRQKCMEDKDRQIPLRFKCNVPKEGSYRIRVTVRAGEEISDIRIFTGRRCLAVYQEKLPKGETLCRELLTQVCPIIPRGEETVYENNSVELTVTADIPCLSKVEIEAVQCPVLYIAGDSTVTDQSAEYPYAPESSYAGWGQMLPYFIKGELTVSNHSHSGLTTESFRQEGHAGVLESRVKAGDYMLFQFGHNDQKLMHLKAEEGYRKNLQDYIDECRKKGIYPLLVTPVARNSWRGSDGGYNDLLKEYAGTCLAVGRELGVPVLDLHGLSVAFVTELQKERAKRYFYPSDYTHYNDFGAQRMAALVCEEIRRTCHSPDYSWLAEQLEENPVLWAEPEVREPLQRPEGFDGYEKEPEPFEAIERPSDLLLRAEALDMIIRRAGFFMTNVYNDLFTDVIGHEWYAGVIECGLQNGILTGRICEERLFHPLEPITLLDFIIFLMLAYGSRRTLPGPQACPYDKFVEDRERDYVSAAWQLGVLKADGTELLHEHISRENGAERCGRLRIQ